jgi:hypothetical protein
MGTVAVEIPRSLYEEAAKRGLDIGELEVAALAKALNLDPQTCAKARLDLAVKYLEEGRELAHRDPVQASEKLYKAAEEAVKALTQHYNLKDVLSRVEERGRWTAMDLEKAVAEISKKVGRWFRQSWDAAWVLHVWSFHEAKLDAEGVGERLPDVEKIVQEALKIVGGH